MKESQDALDEFKQRKSAFSFAFRQQLMKAWKPVPTIKSTIWFFFVMSIIFLAFGIAILILSMQIIELTIQYDNAPTCAGNIGVVCQVQFFVDQPIKGPVMVYYQLDNFYQNHRRYVKSKDLDQLNGASLPVSSLTLCDPIFTNKDLGRNLSIGNQPLNENDPANPCGLIAKSFFNDTYQIFNPSHNQINISEKDIAWPADKQNKFKNNPDSARIQWQDVEDPHFIVWMRVAAFPSFRKLWGRITQDYLAVGFYTLTIRNNYDVSRFSGKKSVVLSNANAFGGKNYFLAIAYLVVGSVSFVISIVFFIQRRRERNVKTGIALKTN